MALSREEYPSMLESLSPSAAVNILNDRVKHVGKINLEVADWLAERRRIEEIYVAGLRKLAVREPPNDASEMGVFTTPWQKITSSAMSLADSHQALASRIDINIEQPLRHFASGNREMQAMSTMQGNLQSIARDCDTAQKKADKRGESNTSDLESASSQWKSQAPYVFEALQAVDEGRCNFLRDVLTQYVTLEVELVEQNQKTSENVLNTLLNVDTANEIRTFVARSKDNLTQRTPTARRSSRAGQSSIASTPSMSNTNATPAAVDLARQRSPPTTVEKKSRFGGLKRIGTLASRRKSVQPTPPPQLGKGGSNPSLGEAGVGSSSRPTGSRLRPTREDSEASFPPSSPQASRDSGAALNGERPQMARDISGASLGDIAPPPGPPPSQRPQNSGLGSLSNDLAGLTIAAPAGAAIGGQSLLPDQSQQQSNTQPKASTNGISTNATNTKDQDGFSVPPPATDPISQAQAEAEIANTGSQPKVLLRDAPITEDKAQSEAAMADMANKLREQAAPPRRTGTNRGRRDVRSAIFAPSQMPLAAPADDTARSVSQQRQTTTSPTLASPIEETQGQLQSRPMIAPSFASPTDSQPHEPPALASANSSQPGESLVSNFESSNSRGASAFGATGSSSGISNSIFATPFVSSLYSGQTSMPSASSPPVTIVQPSMAPPTMIPSAEPAGPTPRAFPMDESSAQSDTQSIRSSRSAAASAAGGLARHPELTSPGLSSSIIETVSAWFENGTVTRATLIGEIALAYNGNVTTPGSYSPETIRLENFSELEKVAPNPTFVTATTSTGTDRAGEYSIDVTAIPRTTVAFKYQLHLDSPGYMAPLSLTPNWRVEATQASVILTYGPNPALMHPITLQNVVIAITVEGTIARSCMSKPTGTFSRERSMIYWRIEEIALTPETAGQKLLARFATDGEARPGRVEARWEINSPSGNVGSGLGLSKLESHGTDPFADSDESATSGGTWKDVDIVRKIISGTYTAH